jgi:signal transduction histidine kinase/CheY-like chemotaxis protein
MVVMNKEHTEQEPDAIHPAFRWLDALPLPAFLFSLNHAGELHLHHISAGLHQLGIPDNATDIHALTGGEEAEALTQACRLALQQPQQSFQFHLRLRGSANSTRHYVGRTCTMRISDSAETLGLALLCDVSGDEALHQLIAREMRDSALQTLVAGLVHDFRNTLTHIIGTTELLLFKTDDPDITHDLNQMLKSAEQGSDMLTRLQHMIRIPSDATPAEHASASPYPSLAAMLELLRAGLPAPIGMQIHLEEPLPRAGMAEPQVRQILLALIANAAEAIPHAGIITVELAQTLEHRFNVNQPALRIRVSDDGAGIAREHMDEVTRPFWTTRDEPGKLGLGLAIVSRLVRLHGGRMDIQSRPNAGTSISILLPPVATEPVQSSPLPDQPAVRSAPASEAPSRPQEKSVGGEMQPWTILLVDDSPEVLHVHQGMLERMGHRVITALNGFDAIHAYHDHTSEIALLVTDFRMPGMDGVDLAVELRKLRQDLPVLMITAYGDADKLQQLHRMQINLLDKPVSYSRLESTLLHLQKSEA